jgi:hypothetical protein
MSVNNRPAECQGGDQERNQVKFVIMDYIGSEILDGESESPCEPGVVTRSAVEMKDGDSHLLQFDGLSPRAKKSAKAVRRAAGE